VGHEWVTVKLLLGHPFADVRWRSDGVAPSLNQISIFLIERQNNLFTTADAPVCRKKVLVIRLSSCVNDVEKVMVQWLFIVVVPY
jgi:hypothetical protein